MCAPLFSGALFHSVLFSVIFSKTMRKRLRIQFLHRIQVDLVTSETDFMSFTKSPVKGKRAAKKNCVLYGVGPGPGAYLLPKTVGYEKHDPRKIRMPQYSFGLKNAIKSRTVGPGPGQYDLHDVTRYGAKMSPAYSLGLKPPLKGRGDVGPGPAAYALKDRPNFTGPSPPAYTMGMKLGQKSTSTTPGPNNYSVKINFVKASPPAYSLGLRTALASSKSVSPGPAAYSIRKNCITTNCPPAYSMATRAGGVSLKDTKPGPNQYNLQNFRPGKTGPKFSFGVKHSPFSPPNIVPCDN